MREDLFTACVIRSGRNFAAGLTPKLRRILFRLREAG